MTGHTGKGVPYALGTDALVDYPATSLELANLMERSQVVAFAQVVAVVSVDAGTNEANAVPVITLPAFSAGGTESYWLEFYGVISLVANAALNAWLYDGAGSIGHWWQDYAGGVPSLRFVNARTLVTPSAGAHTYALKGSQQAGHAEVTAGPGGAGQWRPAYMLARRAL